MYHISSLVAGFLNGLLVIWLSNQAGFFGWESIGFAVLSCVIMTIGVNLSIAFRNS